MAADQIGVSWERPRRPSRVEQSQVGAAAGRDLENQWCSLSKSPSTGPSTSLLLISWRARILSFSLLSRCNSMCVFVANQCVFYESNPLVCSGCFGVSVGKRRGSVMRRLPGCTTTLATASRTSCRRSSRPPGARNPRLAVRLQPGYS